MSYPFYIAFGTLPSIIWLLFYLRKDQHPESNRNIIRVFILGAAIAVPAVFLEMGFFDAVKSFNLPELAGNLLNVFLGVAFMEELLKFLVVKNLVLNRPELDEPIDIMLYMMISALGFAAVENILILLQLGPAIFLEKTFEISIFRFLGATFLHTMASGLIGYFLALSIYRKQKKKFVVFGLGISSLLHGIYNFSIMEAGGNDGLNLLIPLILLTILAIFVSAAFKSIRKMKSICEI